MDNSRTAQVFFVIPSHNEGKSVGQVVARVFETFPYAKVAVINDGSSDDTSARASLAGAVVIDLPFNCGYGVALHTGLTWAYRLGAELVVTQDSDGQHDALEALKLVQPVLGGQADLALGSRYLPGSQRYQVPLVRRFGSRLFAGVLTILMGAKITDPTTGFQCLNRKALQIFVNLPDFPERTPDADIILLARKAGCRIVEVPVAMHADLSNDSMHGVLKSLFYVPKMLVALLGVVLGQTPVKRA
jgi:glycosyltransferase involved in cell wall biosynthesis